MGGAACAKIIINGRGAIRILQDIVDEAEKARELNQTLPNEAEIIVLFNEIEDAAFKAQREYLEGQGFTGPWPKSMAD